MKLLFLERTSKINFSRLQIRNLSRNSTTENGRLKNRTTGDTYFDTRQIYSIFESILEYIAIKDFTQEAKSFHDHYPNYQSINQIINLNWGEYRRTFIYLTDKTLPFNVFKTQNNSWYCTDFEYQNVSSNVYIRNY